MRRLWGVLVILAVVGGIVASHVYFMGKKPIVSVVMSTYNRADRVGRAIESVLNQTFKNFEFIIINDGSTDNTSAVLKEFKKKDHRIVLVENKENKGLIYSLNRGLDLARGKYIARIDDDDEMLPKRLEKQVAYMDETTDAAVLCTGYYAFYERENSQGQKIRLRGRVGCPAPPDQVYINLHFANGLSHPTSMLRKSFLDDKKLMYNQSYKSAEDYKLWSDVVRRGGKIYCLQEPLIEYTRAGDNPFSFYRNMGISSRQVRIDMLSDFFDNPEEIVRYPKCDILRQLVDKNKDKKILNQTRLEDEAERSCPKSDLDAWRVKHPFWQDYLILSQDKKSIYRFDGRDKARVISFEGNELVLKWENRGQETFVCDRQKKECSVKKEK